MKSLNPIVSLPVSRTVLAERLDAGWSGIAGVLGIFLSVPRWNTLIDLKRNKRKSIDYGNQILLRTQDV